MKGRGQGRLWARKQCRGRSTSPISLHSSDSGSELGPTPAASHPPAAGPARRNAAGGAPSADAAHPASLQLQPASWRRKDYSAASAGEEESLEPSWPDWLSAPRPLPQRVQPSPRCVELLSDSESDQSSPKRAARAASAHGVALVQSPAMHGALQTPEAAERVAVTPVSPPAACSMQLSTPLQLPSPAAQASPSAACSMQLDSPLQHLRGSAQKSHDVISLLTP